MDDRHIGIRWTRHLAWVLPLLAGTQARAECLSLKSGPIIYDVIGCGAVQPEQVFDTTKDKYAWIAGLDPAGKRKLYDSYRGLYLKGKVVKSQASEKGLGGETGVLAGDNIFIFVPPGMQTCAGVNAKRVSGNLQEICCDGGGDPPCMLNTAYVLKNPQPIGAASSGAGDSTRVKVQNSKDVKAGDKLFRERKWKDATKSYEKALANDELDVKGHYRLGRSYRELDQCPDTIRVLKPIRDARERKQIFADEETTAREAEFLLARCHSRMNEPGAAVLILNSYLLEPRKYKKELRESLSHKDFGWIHTSKEYRDYRKEAQKKLGS